MQDMPTLLFGGKFLKMNGGRYFDYNTVGEYDAVTGATINTSLITGLNAPTGITLSGSKLFVANSANGVVGAGSIGAYNLDGTAVNAALVTGLSNPQDVTEFGGNLYVTDNGNHRVGEYDATTGKVKIKGFYDALGDLAHRAPLLSRLSTGHGTSSSRAPALAVPSASVVPANSPGFFDPDLREPLDTARCAGHPTIGRHGERLPRVTLAKSGDHR
jgi:hypothetical protein